MYIVADIGGTNMRIAAVTENELGVIRKVPTPQDPEEGIAQFAALVREISGGETITAVSGDIAGAVSDAGVISDARNLRRWEGTNIVEALSSTLGVPVYMINDAALVGLGEATKGAGIGAKALMYITVSTGVGGAWIVDGNISASGGIASMKVDGNEIEDLISGTAVKKRFGVDPRELDSIEKRNELADLLAKILYVIQQAWPSDTIVLGGSMIVGVNPIPLERVQTSLRTMFLGETQVPTVKMAELGDLGGLWGGIARIRQLQS